MQIFKAKNMLVLSFFAILGSGGSRVHQLPSVCAWGTLHSRGEGAGQPDDERPGERCIKTSQIGYLKEGCSITSDGHKDKDKMTRRPRRLATRRDN